MPAAELGPRTQFSIILGIIPAINPTYEFHSFVNSADPQIR